MASVKTLSQYRLRIQNSLFPWLEEELGELTEKEEELVTTFRTQDIGVAELCGLVCTSVPATPNLMR